jgi:hypothetical protein
MRCGTTVCLACGPRLRMRMSEPRRQGIVDARSVVHQPRDRLRCAVESSRHGNPHAYPPNLYTGARSELFYR